MEYSSPAVSLFKDLGGVELLSQRLHVEVQRVIGTVDGQTSMITDAVKSEEDHLYSQKRLIKALLKALGSATYSPGNPARSQSSQDNSLPELGLPDAFLSSVTAGVVPSCKALICVPNGLGAICLNNQGLEAVRETSALRFLVDTFTSRKYLMPMNEGVVLLANAVEELLRHVQSLRSTGVDIIIEIINKLCSSQEDKSNEPAISEEEKTDMETDVEGRDLVSAMDSSAEGMNDEQFSHLSIFHVMHLNFEGHSVSSEKEIAVTTKCRYLGKVVEFIDGILMDRPESCNPIMVNSFYCRGVIQAILTTFQATSELLFTMSRPPSSPMDTDSKTGKDGKETDSSWIYGPSPAMGQLWTILFPQDAERFMKLLQSKVLKTVLPIWAHPQFPECNIELISSVTSIMRHVCTGVEVKNTVGNGSARLAGPPPDENAISLIVDMGFSRARAEEALRQVGTNSVEIATDWLFSHPEEPQEEDDELARALAMSLGNSDTSAQEEDSRSNDLELEEETVQLPPIDEILHSCLRLLQTKEALAFPVRDMLVTISSQNDGQNRVKVLTYLIDNLKQCVMASESLKDTTLSALFHVLALILHGDTAAREVASKAGLVKVALDLLCSWELGPRESEVAEVPNWVTSCFLSVDRMLQVEPKLPDVTELDVLKKENSNTKTSLVIDDNKKKDSESLSSVGLLDLEDQKQLLKICCKCIEKQLPSASMHAILQLCATLTKVHAAAICFLESGGLNALLSLPTGSLFSGFNNVASTIIRHILEDPHTLQQAMELEIRHSLVTAANRHANPRVTPRNFVQNLAFVVYRDPVIFMKAAQAVCQIEMVGDRPYVVLLKDREKERSKEKDKDKDKPADKDKAAGAATKVTSGDIAAGSPASAQGKQPDLNARNVKPHRKPPQSFVTVIEHLLGLVMSFVPPPRSEDQADVVSGTTSSSDMDIDCSSAKGKGKAVAVAPEESKHAVQEATASLAKSAFVLKLLTDVLLTYASSIQVVLRHDADLSNMHGPNRPGAGIISGGIFTHILQHFLPHAVKQKKDRKTEGDWRYKLATRANQFLVASSIRSAEGRKRIFSEICCIFLDFTDSSTAYKAPVSRLNAYVDLLNDILSARSPTGSSLSAESAVTFVEVGLVQSLSRTLQVLDLDHPDSAKIVTSIVKALEVVTKEHVHSADLNAKGENSSKIASDSNNVDSSSNRFQALDTTSQPTEMVTDDREAFNGVQTSQSSDSVEDEMDHDQNLVEMAFSDRNHESSSSRLDAIFRSLRSGRNGHRFNMWLDDSPQRSGSAAPAVPEGIEELLISHLRRPTPEQPDVQRTPAGATQENEQPTNVSEAEAREEAPAEQNENNENTVNPVDVSESAEPAPPDSDALQRDVSNASEHATEMQYERSDAVARDVEAVSQASSGSGATLGESLRSLEVEIGSVEGHDDGDRHGASGASDRLPLGDMQATARSRRPSGSAVPIGSRDISLESVSEVPQNPNQEPDQNANEGNQEPARAADADSIDPTFLEALPEDLRAEVLSSRQNQVAQTSNDQPQNDGDIDPEFLAALPPDIREEVLAQQRAQRLQQQSQELEGQPVEMDAVSIIATFPSEIREEVLLTSPDTLLATLTPALVAEANMLRERFAHRYHSSSLFGMNSRNRRGESSRREIMAAGLDRNGDPSRSTSKPIETEGAPLVDDDALKALIRLLRVVQPLYKGQLQRLLLNLCAHRDSRKSLVQILVDMLMLDLQGSSKKSIDGTEPPFRLYGCHANITYSRPQSSDGVPPLVSRRVLETLTYLARSHPNVAKLLLFLEFPCPSRGRTEALDQRRGKAVVEDGEERKAFALVLLLTLLNQPLYMRSVAHLEQLLNLLEVVMLNAENQIIQARLEASSEKSSGPENAVPDGQDNTDVSESSGSKSNAEDSSKTPAVDNENNLQAVLQSLPKPELRLLCSLLAHDGLSDNAYLLVAEVLKKIVALAPFFCCHFINELARSMQNLTLCAMKELRLYENSEKALLSSSSANGTAILRVVQALSSLVTTLQEKKDPELPAEKDHSDAVSQISEINTALDALWLELSNCISTIESSSEYASNLSPASANAPTLATGVAPPLPAGTQNILPYIESFFVTCEKLRPGQPDAVQEASTSDMEDASTSSGGQRSSSGQASLDEKQNAFVKFSEKHRRLLNAFIRQNPGLLEKSFSLMLKIPRLIDFDNKRAYFRSKIKHQHDHHHSPVRISVRRAYILEDSYNQLRMRSPQELKGRLTVHFQGEEGIDAGGLTREWYQSLSRVIFDKGALLFTTVGNDLTFQPNPNSVYQTEHLSYFKFVGRVVGKALFDGQLLDAHFTRSFYKHILGAKVTYHDIEAIDPAYYKNLKWMLENDISDVLDLTFSMDADEEKLILYEKTEVTDCELIPGGRNIRVTEENKHEYVDRVAEHRLTTAIRPQINAFLEGFNELIPRELISIFNDKELELLISGLPDIDLDDLKANTEYSGYSIASPVIQWFWEIVQGFSKEDKARFLQFVTGTSKVPLEGFSALQGISGPQRFQIHKAYGSTNHLPSAHTCFNQLDLPEYTSKEQLQERLLLAIHEANEGFGFG
ncbi:E3 ubiquitin-protein ligase UPL1 -like protein [Panicum miliaceum]|uniref:HECT-type E3 ubiquitin transferase n=1 Tax=Panicum miliaceum TaxID=4540 RepID=A0A3L6T246_PANMI|nr:E3 ubiquitin-protein ligase UPL1 -like protein [Panicum miliaceum]